MQVRDAIHWRTLLRKTLFAGLIAFLFAYVATAAVDPFYLEQLRRGLARFDAGDYPSAASELRLAAFGVVDTLDLFEIAHIYAAIASTSAKDEPEAKRSVMRVVAAERIARTYARLKLPNHVRTQFEAIAKAELPPNQYAFLVANGSPAEGTFVLPVAATAPGTTLPTDPPATTPLPQSVVPAPMQQNPAPVIRAPKRTARPIQPAVQPPMQPPAVQPAPVQPAAVQPPAVQPAVQPAAVQPATVQPPQAQPSVQPGTPNPSTTKPPSAQSPTPAPRSSAPAPSAPRPAVSPTPSGAPGESTAPQPAGNREPDKPPATAHTSAAPAQATSGPKLDPPSAPKAVPASGSLADAARAVAAGDLARARAIYNKHLDEAQIGHAELLEIGAGLYRARDFQGAVRAFNRAGSFAKGEEPNRYYFAVALYETGRYAAAKRELAAALPFIAITPDVVRYRAQIEGAIQ